MGRKKPWRPLPCILRRAKTADGFIGHNGAGKTTTLRSVAGILQFDAG